VLQVEPALREVAFIGFACYQQATAANIPSLSV
jgi:hypothetical protein